MTIDINWPILAVSRTTPPIPPSDRKYRQQPARRSSVGFADYPRSRHHRTGRSVSAQQPSRVMSPVPKTRSPTLNRATAAPTALTTPANSQPKRLRPPGSALHMLRMVASPGLTPIARTSTKTSFSRGVGLQFAWCPQPSRSTPQYSPLHSHSIVLKHHNALIHRAKSFR